MVSALKSEEIQIEDVSFSIPLIPYSMITSISGGTVTSGSPANWEANVDENGVLTFNWTTNTPTEVDPIMALSQNIETSSYLASKVTAPASVVTGIENTTKVISDIKTTTSEVVTGINISQPTVTLLTAEDGNGDVSVITNASASLDITKQSIDVLQNVSIVTEEGENAIPFVSSVEVSSVETEFSGTAAPQTWTQNSGTTSDPVEEVK